MPETNNPQLTRILSDDAWYRVHDLQLFGIDPARIEAARQAKILTAVETGNPRGQQRPENVMYSGRALQQWLAAGAPVIKSSR